MASSGKGTRWGSLLSQAVAGVEARLDTILADTDESAKLAKSPAPAQTPRSTGTPRSGSSTRANDRLQERLARAVAAKNAGTSPNRAVSPAAASPTASPRQSIDAPRASVDSSPSAKESRPAATITTDSPRPSSDMAKRPSLDSTSKDTNGEASSANASRPATPAAPVLSVTPAPEDSSPGDSTATGTPAETGTSTKDVESALHAPRVKQLEEELQEEQRQHQEEVHHYVEKIEALQSQVQYLSREAAEAAKKVVESAEPGSLEKKLGEKDQQIARLMEEGKTLGVTEQKHRTILKKLRAKVSEHEKEIDELKAAHSKADTELQTLRPRARRAAELEKAQEESRRRLGQMQKELEGVRADASAKDAALADLKKQLEAASDHAEAMKTKINDEALQKERQRVKDLEEQVSTLQLEKTLAADRAKAQVAEWKDKAERAAERTRINEVEAKAEVQVMESKLEAMRARAEEASSGAIGDSQAKLLRQVETLQTQYAIASENWQGIETTLLARVANLEKERDEALQRESDMRKKAREATLRAKRHEEDLEEARSRFPKAQEDAGAFEAQIDALKKQADEAETALQRAQADLEREKAAAAALREEKQERERERGGDLGDRRTWLEDLPAHPLPPNRTGSRPGTPLVPGMPGRTWSSDFLGLQGLSGLPNKLRKVSAPSSQDDPAERFSLRRPSVQPPTRPAILIGSNTSQPAQPTVFSPTVTEAAAPSSIGLSHPADALEDPLEGLERSGSPQQVMQDMVSVSTVAAGPSVQLVERMSAAIRRLESEKVAAREELARISNQRNEARAEVLALIKEADAGKAAASRVSELEVQVADIQARYDTTLELLGEKSELVDELQADVQDVKAMYRDLVERTIK